MVWSYIGQTHKNCFYKLSAPLTQLTRKDITYKGGALPPNTMLAYLQLKLVLTSDPAVVYLRSDRHYALIVDASTSSATAEGGGGTGSFFGPSQQNRSLTGHL